MPASIPSRRRREAAQPFDHGEPIWQASYGPHAIVLAVAALLVALAYPAQTHAVAIDLPSPSAHELGPLSPPTNLVSIDRRGTVSWNSERVTLSELLDNLEFSKREEVQPVLKFEPAADAPYGEALRVMTLIASAGLADRCFRFGNTARFAHYELSEPASPSPAEARHCTPPPGPMPASI